MSMSEKEQKNLVFIFQEANLWANLRWTWAAQEFSKNIPLREFLLIYLGTIKMFKMLDYNPIENIFSSKYFF